MISKRNMLLLALVLIFTPFILSQAQTGRITLRGSVTETTLLSNNNLHVWLQSDRDVSEVCLGPTRFLDTQGFVPSVGDNIEVTGTRVGNGSLFVADSLQMGGRTLALRGASVASGCPGCSGYNCMHHDCAGYDHGCNHHHGHCCDHD